MLRSKQTYFQIETRVRRKHIAQSKHVDRKNIKGVIVLCLFSMGEVPGFWIEGLSFKGSKNLVKSCMKIPLGSNENCMKQSMQEALGASGFEGCIEMVILSHWSFSKQNKYAGSMCPIKAACRKLILRNRRRLRGSKLGQLKEAERQSKGAKSKEA